jgi:hypothetical protein
MLRFVKGGCESLEPFDVNVLLSNLEEKTPKIGETSVVLQPIVMILGRPVSF